MSYVARTAVRTLGGRLCERGDEVMGGRKQSVLALSVHGRELGLERDEGQQARDVGASSERVADVREQLDRRGLVDDGATGCERAKVGEGGTDRLADAWPKARRARPPGKIRAVSTGHDERVERGPRARPTTAPDDGHTTTNEAEAQSTVEALAWAVPRP